MSAEVWRPVEGWPYEVSDLGRVRRTGAARGARVGNVLKGTRHPNGYPVVMLCAGVHTKRLEYVHILVAAAFLGPRPPGAHVNHRDGDKANPALSNLEYVTPSENAIHAIVSGLKPGVSLAERTRELIAAREEIESLRAEVASLRAELARLRGEAA